MLQFPGRTITIYDIAGLLGEAFPRAMAPTNIINGFRVSGIWPLNANIFTDDEFLTSSVTDRPDPAAVGSLPSAPTTLNSDSITVDPTIPPLAVQPNASVETPTRTVSDNPQAGTSKSTDQKHYSPHDIMPFPKAAPRMMSSTRGRKKARSRILTDTPEKAEIEQHNQMMALKKNKVSKADQESFKKARENAKKTILASSSDEEDSDLPSLADSSDGSDFIDESDEEILKEPELNDFVLVQFPTKKTLKFYIGKIIDLNNKSFKVNFLRRKGLSEGFCFPMVEDISEVDRKEIVKVLPHPSIRGTTRTAGIFKFRQKFDITVN